MSNTAQLLTFIDDLLGGASPLVTKEEHKPVLEALVNSLLNKETDAGLLGLKNFDSSRSYLKDEGAFFNSEIWKANINISPGLFNPSDWKQITGLASADDYDLLEWDANHNGGFGYNQDDNVIRDERVWISDSDSNTSDPLVSGWTEISANESQYGSDWITKTLYLNYQTITDPSDRKLYYLDTLPGNIPYYSTNLAAEILGGDWKPVPANGVPIGTENLMSKFNASGNLVETDEIKVVGTEAQIKNKLKLLTGALIERVDEDGTIISRLDKNQALVDFIGGLFLVGKNDFTQGYVGATATGFLAGMNDEAIEFLSSKLELFKGFGAKKGFRINPDFASVPAFTMYDLLLQPKSGTIALLSDVSTISKSSFFLELSDNYGNPTPLPITSNYENVVGNFLFNTNDSAKWVHLGNGEVQYIGSETLENISFILNGLKIRASGGGSAPEYETSIFINGVVQNRRNRSSAVGNRSPAVVIFPNLTIVQNDTFRIKVRNITNNNGDLTIEQMQLMRIG